MIKTLKAILLLFIAASFPLSAQTAITALTSFWEMDVDTADRIAFDSRGGRHGMFVGKGMVAPGTIFGGGVQGTSGIVGGMSIAPNFFPASGTGRSYTWAVWTRPHGSDPIMGRWGSASISSWKINIGFNGGRLNFNYTKTDNAQALLAITSGTGSAVSDGTLILAWLAYDSSDGSIKIAMNGGDWTSTITSPAFRSDCDIELDWGHSRTTTTGTAVVGRTMYWDGYIPSLSERQDIYNSGNGRAYTYFNPGGFTPPTRPFTLTLQDSTFADDANLSGQQGLYFLKPFPLKLWSQTLAASKGDYVWVRSTDHSVGAGGIYIGYSSSPATLPSSWAVAMSDSTLSTDDTSTNWQQLETPHLVWNPDTQKIHMYGHAVDLNACGSPCYQKTHVWTTSDLNTWAWQGVAMPTVVGRNHTGYAQVDRISANNWIAGSLYADAVVGTQFGGWTSADGIAWTATGASTNVGIAIPYTAVGVDKWQWLDSAMAGTILGGITNSAYGGLRGPSGYTSQGPLWPIIDHGGTGTSNDWLQDVRAYEENGEIYVYAKWRYQEPATTRLFKAHASTTLNNRTKQLIWPDRRPIAAMFLADGSKTANNPRGYNVTGTPDFLGAGFSTARSALLTKIGALLDNADQYSPRPQAAIVWDIEGQEMQQSFSYVGYPGDVAGGSRLTVLSPEMETQTAGVPLADEIMNLIRSRGYEPGLTLRPHAFLFGSGRPTNGCKSQGSFDGQVYIDTGATAPNRGYRCGPATSTFADDLVTVTGAFSINYQSGSVVRFYSTGAYPVGITKFTDYYLCNWNNGAQTFNVSDNSNCTPLKSGMSGATGTVTMMSWRGPANLAVQEAAADADTVYALLKSKAQYARARWGVRYFYVDSTVICTNADCQSSTDILNAVWQRLLEDFPDTLFMPETSAGGPWTGKFISFNNAQYKRLSTTTAIHPNYFVTPFINATSPGYTDWRSEIQAEIAAGVPYMVVLNHGAPTGSTPEKLYNDDLAGSAVGAGSLMMTDSATSRVRCFSGSPRTAFRYPLKIRIYFGATTAALETSGTFCEMTDIANCYLDGVKQGSATLNLGSMSFYEMRYYEFTGRQVSRGLAQALN